MIRRRLYLQLLLLTLCCATSMASTVQKFINLTAEEVKIDSVMPYFTYSFPLGEDYADSIYTVSLEYPEFIAMSDGDIARLKKITTETLPVMPEVTSYVAVERKRGHLELFFCPIVMRDGKLMKLVSFMIDVKSKAKRSSVRRANAAKATSTADRYAAHSVLASGSWAKIRVPETGVYRLTSDLVRRAGFTDVSKVKVYGYGGALQNETLVGDELIELDDLMEVPTCTVDGVRLFHAQGSVSWSSNTTLNRTRNPYSDYGYYFITESDDEPLTVDSTTFVDSFYPSADYYHLLYEKDDYAWYQGGRNLYDKTPINLGATATYQINYGTATPGSRKVYVNVTAGVATTLQVSVNGQDTRDLSIGRRSNGTSTFTEYDNALSTTATFTLDSDLPTDTVSITTTMGGPVRLDYISACTETPRERPTLQGKTFAEPEYVCNITNQDLHADGQYDMVIIVPTSGKLTAQAERLKNFHEQNDGMSVRIVPADELYNEFSSGTPDANAYRRYLKMMYDRAESEADMPSSLLLFGDCVWDNRMLTSTCSSLSPDDFLLCHESEESFNHINCYVNEGFFVCLDDGEGGSPKISDKLDMAVGRISARTADEAEIAVDKTISYVENANAGSWQNTVVFLGDDGNDNVLMQDADEIASEIEKLNPSMVVKRVMWDAYERTVSSTGNSYPEVVKLVKQYQQSGALIMNYTGHASADAMSHEYVLRLNDFTNFTNTNLPLWVTATCDIMPFDMQIDNIGETAIFNSNGGAVGFMGTTRTVHITDNRKINESFMTHLFTPVNGNYISIGEALRLAKNEMISNGLDLSENKLNYSLLGDPALVLNIPRHGVVIDSINGVELKTASTLPSMRAGDIVTVKGHIEAADGQKDTSFNGTATASVRDAEKQIVCRLNDTSSSGASTAFTYYDRTNTLYNGSNNVTDGEFTFTFAMTKDIDYSNESGLINVFAVNSDTKETVNGYSEDFIVGGTGSLVTDSIGPSIYCYLNSPSFTNGDNVNSTPYFYAELYDKDGINASGSGIGHDLTLTIDGDMNKTYTLNDNFSFDFGSYTKGSTYYNIPELEAGKHTLRFRAWDIMNNLSTTELTFNVLEGMPPGYLNISTTTNPASEKTTFVINHDRAGSDISIVINVYDISGRPVWHHKVSGNSATSTYTIDWDLIGDNGKRLRTGVYIYQVKLGSNGGSMIDKARKLVVISN